MHAAHAHSVCTNIQHIQTCDLILVYILYNRPNLLCRSPVHAWDSVERNKKRYIGLF